MVYLKKKKTLVEQWGFFNFELILEDRGIVDGFSHKFSFYFEYASKYRIHAFVSNVLWCFTPSLNFTVLFCFQFHFTCRSRGLFYEGGFVISEITSGLNSQCCEAGSLLVGGHLHGNLCCRPNPLPEWVMTPTNLSGKWHYHSRKIPELVA